MISSAISMLVDKNPTLAERIIDFYYSLEPSDWKLPPGISLLNPFENLEARPIFEEFYRKYFSDQNQRHLIVGINPGRFGAGITGIPFTDPKTLEEECNIQNDFNKRYELSAIFIYEMIKNYQSIEAFYKKFVISSVVPLGFVKNGKNINYYDDKALQESLTPHIVDYMQKQIKMGLATDKAFILGQGKNFKYFHKLNEKEQFFSEVIPLPHPRWVMQYRLKRKQEYLDEYILKLGSVGVA